MPNYYILNSAVITTPGSYRYDLATIAKALAWAREREWSSTVGYEETANALGQLLGVEVPVNRVVIRMRPGDEALVFRLVLPPGCRRIPPDMKGRLRQEYIIRHAEMGILRRTE